MFKFIIGSLLLLPILANAAQEDKLIKSCKTTIKWSVLLDDKNPRAEFDIQIKEKSDKSLHAVTVTRSKGETRTFNDRVQVVEGSVREGITEDSNIDNLNETESVIAGAMTFTGKLVDHKMSAGLDLAKVRKAKMYAIGDYTRMGALTVVEAYDQEGAILGSFMGGSIAVGKCE